MKKNKIYNVLDLYQYLNNKYNIPYMKIKGEKIHLEHPFCIKNEIFIRLENEKLFVFESSYSIFTKLEDLEKYLCDRVFVLTKKNHQIAFDI